MKQYIRRIAAAIPLVMLCFLSSTMLFGQELDKLYKSENYKEIETELKNNESKLKNASKKEIKAYDRWKWFYSTRVDSSGRLDPSRPHITATAQTLGSAIIVN